jgi:hypothetical protein
VLLPHQVCQVSEERNATFDQSFGIWYIWRWWLVFIIMNFIDTQNLQYI